MENYYKVTLGEHLIADKEFMTSIRNHITSLYNNKGQEVLQKEDCQAKLFLDAISKCYYLIIDRNGLYHVYRDTANKASEAFRYALKRLEEDSKSSIYSSDFVCSVSKTEPGEKGSVIEDYIRNTMGYTDNDPDLLRAYRSIVSNLLGDHEENFSPSPYLIKKALEFFEQQNSYDTSLGYFNYQLLEKNPGLEILVEKRLEDFSIILSFMKNVLKEHKFDSKNDFIFNDADNSFYKKGKYIVIKDQNCIFCIDYKDASNYIVYSTISQYNGWRKKCNSITALMNDIKNGLANNIDHVTLEVKDGTVVFADNGMIYSLDFDLVHTKNELLDQKLGTIEYPIDVTSFDYQYAYVKSKYGYDKMSFLMHAMFVLGNGYSYDEEKGSFYSDKIYDKSVLSCLEKPDNSCDAPFEEIGYFYPKMNITKLDAQWLEALEMIVNKIKTEKPDTTKATLPIGKTFEEVMTYLDGVIEYNKNSYQPKKVSSKM